MIRIRRKNAKGAETRPRMSRSMTVIPASRNRAMKCPPLVKDTTQKSTDSTQGLVTSEVQSSRSGPPRKYFRLTPAGEKALHEMNDHWQYISAAVEAARGAAQGGKP